MPYCTSKITVDVSATSVDMVVRCAILVVSTTKQRGFIMISKSEAAEIVSAGGGINKQDVDASTIEYLIGDIGCKIGNDGKIYNFGDVTEIGDLDGYYGGLLVRVGFDGRMWMGIDNYCGPKWREINRSLYDELIKYNESLD